jgi:ubiquinone/menaquinone biosynthesis C-methylase UbiE
MMFKVKAEKVRYTDLSKIPPDYTDKMNREYNWMAKGYDVFMTIFPLWKKWIKSVLPHMEGYKILEVSFGNGFLMKQYASKAYEIHGIDYNERMLEITQKKMAGANLTTHLLRGNVEELPYPDNTFDTVINTMAFTGYPDGDKAMSEINRVLKPKGKLLLVDFDYPEDGNIFGYYFVRLWEKFGDIIKDIKGLLRKHHFTYESSSVGGFGSVQLFIAIKQEHS